MSVWAKLVDTFRKPKALTPEASGAALQLVSNLKRPPRRGAREALAAYDNISRVRSVVDRIATSIASAEWKVYKAESSGLAMKAQAQLRSIEASRRRDIISGAELEPVDGHPLLALLRRGAPTYGLSGSQVLALTQVYLETSGECFWYLPSSIMGPPAEVAAFPAHWIVEVPTPGSSAGYFKIECQYLRASIPADQVVWLKHPSAVDPFGRGSGIGMTISEDLDIDEYAARTLAARFENDAIPEFVVAIDGLTEPQARDVEARFLQKHRGFSKTGLPHFTSGKTKITQLSPKIVDLDVDNLRMSSAKNIREAWGLPPEILGIIDNSNRSTIDAASYLFALLVTDPRLRFLEEQLNLHVLPRFDATENLVVCYESPIPEDWEFAAQVMQAHSSAFSINEVRKVAGFEPIDGHDDISAGEPEPEADDLEDD